VKQLNYQLGKKGEKIAADFLKKNGFEIIEYNFQTRFGEIDLIGIDKSKLVFVEVKTKVGDRFGWPEEMISRNKFWQIQRTAEAYLLAKPEMEHKFPMQRIDAVAIVLAENGGVERINHYENIALDF
jgi:putative endonuclease